MDIAAQIFRDSGWPDEHRLGAGAIVSPLVAGYVIDVTGNWYLPFLMSMVLLCSEGSVRS